MKHLLPALLILLCLTNTSFADFLWPECPQPTVEGHAGWYSLSSEGYLGVHTGNINNPPSPEEIFQNTYLVDVNNSCEFIPAVLAISQICRNFLEENDAGYSAVISENAISKENVDFYQTLNIQQDLIIKRQAIKIKHLKRKLEKLQKNS